MLLVLDVGNTNTVLGVFAPAKKVTPSGDHGNEAESPRYQLLVANWRVATVATQTVDEYGVLFRNLFAMDNLEAKGIDGIVSNGCNCMHGSFLMLPVISATGRRHQFMAEF